MSGKGNQFAQRLLSWFSANGRDLLWRHDIDPYKILVVEKLLQQTTYRQVMNVYSAFFDKFPDIQKLARANVLDIEATIRGLGFQRQRAKQFREMAQVLVKELGGRIPSNKEGLLKLKGIGDYVANAVLCFAFNEAVAIVDVNVRRVVGRFFGWEGIRDREIERRVLELIPEGKSKQFNWAVIDFSALICSRKPKCENCFLNDLCSFLNSHLQERR